MAALLVLVAFITGTLPEVKLDEAIRLYEKGEVNQALPVLTQLKNKEPENHEVRFWIGKTYMKTHEWDNAVRELEKLVELQPDNARNYLWLGRAYGKRAAHVVFFKAFGLARRVAKSFEKARELSPANLDVRFDLLDYYLNAPGIVGGGKDKAENEIKSISEINARMGYPARAALMMKDKRWDLAKKELLQATIDYPNDAGSFKDLAEFQLERQDFKEALINAEKSLALNDKSKKSRLIAAAARIKCKSDIDEALKSLVMLASGSLNDNEPAFEDVYYWIGECYLAKGDKKKAFESFSSALAFNSEHEQAKKSISKLK